MKFHTIALQRFFESCIIVMGGKISRIHHS